MKILHAAWYMDCVQTLLFSDGTKNDKCSSKHLFQTTDIVRSFLIHQVKLHQIQVNTFIKVSTSSSIPPSNGAARRKINLFLFQFVSMS